MNSRMHGPSGRSCLVIAMMLISGCGSDEPQTSTEPTFSSIQETVFTPTCARTGCHSGTPSTDGNGYMILEEGQAYGNIVGQVAEELYEMDRVHPGDPENSYLVHKLRGTHKDVGGSGNRMPLSGYVTDQQIAAIEEWITNGAENN